ncbi:hypothetical protein BDN72DRAFT_329309 [Pluteus cervinus]|uniref:Uncharacterized protein n=1 Tax=Pluteus cervinus TaxID=181527 RepID=A0ACD3ACU7_9AGAR|nr:hypothetical protein BDN72DRAFT_329309 [Pluteus cervinus]
MRPVMHGQEVWSYINALEHSPLRAQFAMSDNPESALAVVDAIRIIQYFTLASSTVYLYDLLLTLGSEIDLLWPSKWTLMKVLYLLQRYLPLIDMVIVTIIWQFWEVSDLQACKILFHGFDWSYLVGMTLSEIVLTLRTLAVWGNTTRIRIILFIFSLGCMVPLYWAKAVESFRYHSIAIPGMYCFVTSGPEKRYIFWVLLTAYDTSLLILIATPAFRAYKASRIIQQSQLSQVVYKDGVLYYLYLVALSAINIILNLKFPDSDATLAAISVQRVLFSILTSRVVLHIREEAYQTEVVMTSPHAVDMNAEVLFRRSEI